MKKLLGILVLGLGLVVSVKANAIAMKNNGQGNLVLSEEVIKEFYSYITTKIQNNPLNFFITEDHKNVFVIINKDTSYKGYSGSGPILPSIWKRAR